MAIDGVEVGILEEEAVGLSKLQLDAMSEVRHFESIASHFEHGGVVIGGHDADGRMPLAEGDGQGGVAGSDFQEVTTKVVLGEGVGDLLDSRTLLNAVPADGLVEVVGRPEVGMANHAVSS